MKNVHFYWICLLSIFVLFGLSSCKKERDKKAAIKFGEVLERYPAFGQDYKSQILEVKLQLDFNEYAIRDNSYVDLEFVDKDGKAVSNIKYYLDGKAFDNNFNYQRIRAIDHKNNKVIKLGVQFLDGIEEEHYKGYLRVRKSSLDRIDDTDVASAQNPILYRWTAKYTRKMHPIVQGILAFLAAVFTFLLIWFLLIKPLFYPRFKGGELEFLEPDLGSFRIKGNRKFVLGGKTKVKQGGISKLFKGKIAQKLRAEEDLELVLTPHKKRGTTWTRYKADGSMDMTPSNRGTFYNFEEYSIKTPSGKKYKFIYKNRKHKRRF